MLQPAGAHIPFNSNVYETGFVSLLSFANGIPDVVRAVHPNARDTEPRCQCGEVHCRLSQVHLDELASGGALAEVFEHVEFEDAIGAVVRDYPSHGNLMVGGRPQRLDRVERRAVAAYRQDRPVLSSELYADWVWHARAEPTSRRTVMRPCLREAQVAHEVAARGHGFVEDDRVRQHCVRDFAHHPPGIYRYRVPARAGGAFQRLHHLSAHCFDGPGAIPRGVPLCLRHRLLQARHYLCHREAWVGEKSDLDGPVLADLSCVEVDVDYASRLSERRTFDGEKQRQH